MNANDRRQIVKAVLDTVKSAEGQLDMMHMETDGNSIPEAAKAHWSETKEALSRLEQVADDWLSYETEKLS